MTTEEIILNCRRAYADGDCPLALFHAAQIVVRSRSELIPPNVLAEAYYITGNIQEMDELDGEALRSWSTALSILDACDEKFADLRLLVTNAIHVYFSAPRAFVSYASSDRDKKTILKKYLERHSVRCIDYESDFVAGRKISDEIRDAIRRVSSTIVMWSADYCRRAYCMEELAVARLVGRIVLLRLDMTAESELDRHLIWIDASGGLAAKNMRRVLRAVCAMR